MKIKWIYLKTSSLLHPRPFPHPMITTHQNQQTEYYLFITALPQDDKLLRLGLTFAGGGDGLTFQAYTQFTYYFRDY